MKKLIAFVLVLMVSLNAAVLLSKKENNTEEGKQTALRLPKLKLNEIKPGMLPGLIRF